MVFMSPNDIATIALQITVVGWTVSQLCRRNTCSRDTVIAAYKENAVMSVPVVTRISILINFILQIREERTVSNKLAVGLVCKPAASHPTIDDFIY